MDATTKTCPICGADAPADAAQCACGHTFATPNVAGPAERWDFAGRAFVGLGLLCLCLSLLIGTTVETGGPYGGGQVVNLDLQFYKRLAIDGSLFAIGLGVFCLGVGSILEAIGRKG